MPAFRKTTSIILTLLVFAAPFAAYVERQNLYDWYRLHNYVVPRTIAGLATDTTMDAHSRKIFYVAHPELQTKSAFNASCKTIEKTIVLGCYKAGIGIFVYEVADTRLNGVLQVTAAHEMLHAAYERLSTKDRLRIDALTQQTYAQLADERVKTNIDAYRSRDASVVPNELHSILGTEVRNLPPELENYYKTYFTDREKIVAYSEQYEAEFTNRETAILTYDTQLKSLKSTIDGLNVLLKTEGQAIDASSANLDANLGAHNVEAYNSSIPAYQHMILAYNANVSRLKAAITTYNTIVDKRNSVVTEEQELTNAIDSSVPASK